MDNKELKDKFHLSARKEFSKRKIKTLLARLVLVLFILVILAVVGLLIFQIVRVSGKNSIYQEQEGVRPNLMLDELEDGWEVEEPEVTPEPVATEEPTISEEDGAPTPAPTVAPTPAPTATPAPTPEYWENDWIRYNGKVYDFDEDVMCFLVMGVDKNSEVKDVVSKTDGGQTDAMFLTIIDQSDKNISMIAINRDTMVDIYLYGYEKNGVTPVTTAQITVQHGFGDGKHQSCEYTVKAVKDLFYGIPIHGYMAVNMAAIPTINDAVGGVELVCLEDLTYKNPAWKKGAEIHLGGMDSYWYCKYRDHMKAGTAPLRLQRQKQYLTAFADKARTAMKKDITLPVTLYNEISKYMVTDLEVNEVAYLATEFMNFHFEGNQIYSMEGETKKGTEFEEFYPDKKQLRQLVINLFYDEVKMD